MSDALLSRRLQATGVAIDGRGVVIHGPPGAGKSDLALRMIDRGARLIGDDALDLVVAGGRVMASRCLSGPGGLHVAGIGRVAVSEIDRPVPVALAVALPAFGEARPRDSARWSDVGRFALLPGWFVPEMTLWPAESSAAIKLVLALERWGH